MKRGVRQPQDQQLPYQPSATDHCLMSSPPPRTHVSIIKRLVRSMRLKECSLIPTVLSRSEKVLGSKELEESARGVLESLPSMGPREARAEAKMGERIEERREKRETGSSPCWYSYPGSIVYGFTTWFGGNRLSVSLDGTLTSDTCEAALFGTGMGMENVGQLGHIW